MKLRLILLILSLMAVIFASAGGYFYYTSFKETAFREAESETIIRLERINKNLASLLSEYNKPVRILAGMQELQKLLSNFGPETLAAANRILDHFRNTLEADVCYLMNNKGDTIASSNRNDPDSFVGQNFSFRPYFKMAIMGQDASYLALGTTSGKRGVYFSYPIYEYGKESPEGIVVIKGSVEMIERELGIPGDEIVMVTDPNGVVFISNRQDWLYKTAWKISEESIAEIAASRQFGSGPWEWIGLEMNEQEYVIDRNGKKYLYHQTEMDNYPGWKVMHLLDMKKISQEAFKPLVVFVRPLVLTFFIVLGLSVLVLYRQASQEIRQRRAAEEALRESDKRYRSLYHNTPAMLHSIDKQGHIVSVSNYWSEVLGYSENEVIGRKLTDFFTDASKRYAEEVVLPDFFKTGYCTDIPYQFVKKDGEIIDILLSAIGDRDEKGDIIRTLAVSIDVTERNRAVEALRLAKEELSSYSKDLEKQVSIRTREITNILKYTPDVVYVKDREGKYVLVNSRFEELFGVSNEEVRGKTDYEIMSKEVADEFRKNDLQVLKDGRSMQVEERVLHNSEVHTYLSVKFPVYDETGAVNGVCGISTDISAVKKAQDQLRRLSGSIMTSQEKERTAIARELHDELGQVLTALRMDAVWMQERLKGNDPNIAERTLTMCDLIDKTIKDVRSIAIRLRPGVLDDLGLVDALEWLTSDFENRSGITCVFENSDVPELNETVSTAAYRICQEAMTNVARYAEASRVSVVLKAEDNILSLSVRDDGKGFNTEGLSEFEGVGIAGMRERATLAGGSLEVMSEEGKGCHVLFKVPIRQDTKETG
ncbi:MAG: PAS domain S-box protein [Deltaproteobacteria bacterium]|nr:MAG: PAS domain S-box protein [Deltaproteobacteria bacterium]